MSDDGNIFDNATSGESLPPELVERLMKANRVDLTFPVNLALHAMGFEELSDHLHNVWAFEFDDGQIAFGFGWCKGGHVDPENLPPDQNQAIRRIVIALLEMRGFETVTLPSGAIAIKRDDKLMAVTVPGARPMPPADVEAELAKFREEIEAALGEPPPDDPMARWIG